MWHPNAQPEIETALTGWQPDLVGTLIFVQQGQHVLLIEKKSGHGQGLINGPGGKLEAGEQPAQCALRELHEELGITVQHLMPMAQLRFIDRPGSHWFGYAFIARGAVGVPTESDEARPLWYPIQALPLQRMWPSDALWLPKILAGAQLRADFLMSGEALLQYRWQSWSAPSFDL